jgi:hypothetical protein|tara:strand:- start:57 stop:440 length:384 start_codon:yes stop_codon:yes gene_type:complete
MSLLTKLNIKPTDKVVKVGASLTIEKELNKFFVDTIKEAIVKHPKYAKYYKKDMEQTNVFKQVEKDGVSSVELKTLKGDVILIPVEDVELTNGKDKASLDTAFQVGTIATYINGITKHYIEYIEKKK